MKKTILLFTLVTIIGCSLDTFNSDNLASWSINLDLPLFKTQSTVADMLKDYDELGIEQYQDTSDSIYVFNASTQHDINVINYTITKVGNSIVPIPVPVASYEIDIPVLPSELDGVNLVEVDLTIDVGLDQFNVGLADSVIVNQIELLATNDKNEIARATITNQDILENGILIVENPEELINIRPTSVIVAGLITIYPTDQPGTPIFDQIIELTSHLHAPLILEINETSTFSTPPEKINANIENDIVEKFTLFAQIDNQLEIGGNMQILVSPDTLKFDVNPDTLFTLQLLPNQLQIETIELNQDKFELLADSTYVKVFLNLIGETDAHGNTIPTKFLSSDSINVLLYGNAEVLIDPQNIGEEK